MPHRYLQALSTPAVQEARLRYGSRASVARMTAAVDTDDRLGADEAEFLAARDGFYLATVGETGWPYVQYRGGPPGFLRVLDSGPDLSTLGWADLRGNRHYLSVGNIDMNPRVSLFLMDYAARQRLKILGTARVHDVHDGSPPVGLAEQLALPQGDGPEPGGKVERYITVQVHSYDWNCPQHITPRWTAAELEPALVTMRQELELLRSQNAVLRRRLDPNDGTPDVR